jgi:hypothetical protein
MIRAFIICHLGFLSAFVYKTIQTFQNFVHACQWQFVEIRIEGFFKVEEFRFFINLRSIIGALCIGTYHSLIHG